MAGACHRNKGGIVQAAKAFMGRANEGERSSYPNSAEDESLPAGLEATVTVSNHRLPIERVRNGEDRSFFRVGDRSRAVRAGACVAIAPDQAGCSL